LQNYAEKLFNYSTAVHKIRQKGGTSVQFSSVQFAKINVLLSAKGLQDHDTVIS